MCLLNLSNPAKQCTHSQCQQQTSETISFEDKKRAPIQSISEILAESILKKLKNDSNHAVKRPMPVVFSKESRKI